MECDNCDKEIKECMECGDQITEICFCFESSAGSYHFCSENCWEDFVIESNRDMLSEIDIKDKET